MSVDKRKYLNPRGRVPGVARPDTATAGVEARVFDLLRSHEFTTKFQLYITDTSNPHSGLRGLHLNKLDINDQQAHGISFDIEGVNYWDFGMDFTYRDLILCNDNTVAGGTGLDILRFSRALDDTVANSQCTKCILSYQAGTPRAFTSFFTIEAGDGLGGVNLSVNNSSTGRSSLTVTQRAANNYVAFSCDNVLRFGSDWLKTNVASFFIRDDNATKLRLYMDQNGRFYLGDGSSPTALLHLSAGTATASTAPLKFTSGTNLTSVEDGAMEYDGSNLYFSISSTRYTLATTAGTKRGCVMTLCDGFTPAATGADVSQVVVPYSPDDGTTSITWNVRRIDFRVATAGGAPAVTVEKSTASTAFSATTVGTVTLGSGDYEGHNTTSLGTVASGDKLRFNVGTLATATDWTVEVILGQS